MSSVACPLREMPAPARKSPLRTFNEEPCRLVIGGCSCARVYEDPGRENDEICWQHKYTQGGQLKATTSTSQSELLTLSPLSVNDPCSGWSWILRMIPLEIRSVFRLFL